MDLIIWLAHWLNRENVRSGQTMKRLVYTLRYEMIDCVQHHCDEPVFSSFLSIYSRERPTIANRYIKMLMMSVYRFKAAKTYSSGLRASCLLPRRSWVSTAKNYKKIIKTEWLWLIICIYSINYSFSTIIKYLYNICGTQYFSDPSYSYSFSKMQTKPLVFWIHTHTHPHIHKYLHTFSNSSMHTSYH